MKEIEKLSIVKELAKVMMLLFSIDILAENGHNNFRAYPLIRCVNLQ